MSALPIHFFTIVLNGEPFIRLHYDVLRKLPFDWHWHIVEGAAQLTHDTAWSVAQGGNLHESLHSHGRSNDGTSQYLDQLQRQDPQHISIYRKPLDVIWDGKLEMVRAPLSAIQGECLLWQLDSDEVWNPEQIDIMRKMFLADPSRTAAWFWCMYFVGPSLLVGSRNCYSQNPNQEWLRVWRYRPGMQWAAHEPPMLVVPLPNKSFLDVGRIKPFLHYETENSGLVFQHFSYVNETQLRFKEKYYGYHGAIERWRRLQRQTSFPQRLADFFPWVKDETTVDRIAAIGVTMLITPATMKALQREAPGSTPSPTLPVKRRIALDGCIFQLSATGISRVWSSLMNRWSVNGYAQNILVLDRMRTAPRLPGFEYVDVAAYDEHHTKEDPAMLQAVIDRHKCELFVSTYYSTPLRTPSVLMVYDMIPEMFGFNKNEDTPWVEKRRAIEYAQRFICISEHTRKDLINTYPATAGRAEVVHLGIDPKIFFQPSSQEISNFLQRYKINNPYFMLVGPSLGYKNAEMFFEATRRLPNSRKLEALLIGGYLTSPKIEVLRSKMPWKQLKINDAELRAAYAGARALVYPSRYEGFGLPILEAQSCGCPVITTPWSSIPEVAGQSVTYVRNTQDLANALDDVQNPGVRDQLIRAGAQNSSRFSWQHTTLEVQCIFDAVRSSSRPSWQPNNNVRALALLA